MPVEASLEPIHRRDYVIEAFRRGDSEFVLRGRVRDEKPPGLYVAGDPEPLVMHHMEVEMTVRFPSLEITDVAVEFGEHPQDICPGIATHYRELIGLSVARGFTHKVRELFGGPRGCAHTTALVQAMAPVAVQCAWSMRIAQSREKPQGDQAATRRAHFGHNLDTCHVWAGDGELMRRAARGEEIEPPLPITRRLVALGQDPKQWRRRHPV